MRTFQTWSQSHTHFFRQQLRQDKRVEKERTSRMNSFFHCWQINLSSKENKTVSIYIFAQGQNGHWNAARHTLHLLVSVLIINPFVSLMRTQNLLGFQKSSTRFCHLRFHMLRAQYHCLVSLLSDSSAQQKTILKKQCRRA